MTAVIVLTSVFVGIVLGVTISALCHLAADQYDQGHEEFNRQMGREE